MTRALSRVQTTSGTAYVVTNGAGTAYVVSDRDIADVRREMREHARRAAQGGACNRHERRRLAVLARRGRS